MKLLTKYNRTNIVAITIILLLSAVAYYYVISSILINQLDKDLKVEEQEIVDFVKENNKLPDPTNYKDEQEEFIPLTNERINRSVYSLNIFNQEHKENVLYRQLEFPISVSGKNYKAIIRKSEEETDDLIKFFLKVTLGMVVMLLITIFLINRFLFKNLWKPFNTTLQQIKQFNLSGKEKIKLEKSVIKEFTELNDAVTNMTDRVSKDYNEIKNFTENASHEIQTPLAIIKSKMELLSQSENLQEEQINTIESVFETVNRLSKLNQSLILLTKIDNHQFNENEEVDLSNLINKHFNNYEELIAAKFITLTKNIESNVKIVMNEVLADILVSNLITNSIKHNVDKGNLEISLQQHRLSISNTGTQLNTEPAALFERFKKDESSSDSLGLGLSIVKKICELYHFRVSYNYANLLHTTVITF